MRRGAEPLLLVAAAALLASAGGCRALNRVLLAVHPAPTGWYRVAVAGGSPVSGAAPDDEEAYASRFTAAEPTCDAVRRSARGPLYVLVPAVDGESDAWREVVPTLAASDPGALFVYRWLQYERRPTLAAELARGVRALRACDPDRAVLVVGHGEGGVLAAFAAEGFAVEEPASPVVLVTVAAPLAGWGLLEARADKPRSSFGLDLEGAIPGYPPLPAGVRSVVLRTRPAADEAMRPRAGGHEPNALAVAPPGAATVDLPATVGRDEALLFAAQGVARERWHDWLESPPPSDDSGERRAVCRLRQEVLADGDVVIDVDLGRAPDAGTPLWDGSSLAPEPPDPRSYARCRPCDCAGSGELEPWDEWREVNARAYARLRTLRAPYATAIIPGFHGGGFIARGRLRVGLELLERGWVGALILSGGHRRGGRNEARYLYRLARELAAERGIDVADRLFVEPCAVRSITNLRNGLRLMAAMGVRSGLFVTDTKMTGQALLLHYELDDLVRRDLRCELGRVAYLMGDAPFPRVDDEASACAPLLSWRNNPVTFLLPSRRPSIFWVSPFAGASGRGALDCRGGAPRLVADEPDDQDPFTSACLPRRGHGGLGCEPDADLERNDRLTAEDD